MTTPSTEKETNWEPLKKCKVCGIELVRGVTMLRSTSNLLCIPHNREYVLAGYRKHREKRLVKKTEINHSDSGKEVDRRRYYTYREKRLEKDKLRYTKLRPEQKRERSRIQRERNPEKWKCRQQTRNYIARGILVRQPCEVCGKTPVHAHHTDYTKPLLVKWLCKDHHYELHRKYPVPALRNSDTKKI